MTMQQIMAIIIIFGVVLIVIPLIVGVIGVIHAIRDSVARRRMPPVILIVMAVLAIAILAFDVYCAIRFYGSGKRLYLMIGNMIWSTLDPILLSVGTLLAIGSLGAYVFLSFHPEGDGKTSARRDDGKDAGADSDRRAAQINRALTVVICAVLLIAVSIVVMLKASGLITHDITTCKSPDGKYTILVDNEVQTLSSQQFFYGDVYIRESPLFARRLDEMEQRRVHMDFDPDDILWYEDTVLIPYGNTYLTYYIGSTD